MECHQQATSRVGLDIILVMMVMTTMPTAGQSAAAGVDSNARPAATVPAMYVFGDSTMDVGNNNYLPGDFPRADKPFYGVDFPGGGRPTGRWSNGYNIADFVAKCMGFKRSPPAYLSLTRRSRRSRRRLILKGVSYASAGSGILDSTYAGKYIPLSQQVRYFGETKNQTIATLGACAANDLLSKSLFLISTGNNDLAVFAAAAQSSQQARRNTSSSSAAVAAAYYSALISNYSAAITELYGMGARKLGIVSVGLIGCTPSARVQSPTGECAAAANALAGGFNAALRSLLAGLQRRLRGLSYSMGDLYGAARLIASAFCDGPAQFAAPVNLKQLARPGPATTNGKGRAPNHGGLPRP